MTPNISWLRGNHNFKFGAQYVHIRDNRAFGAFQNATADFGSVQDFINGNVQDYEMNQQLLALEDLLRQEPAARIECCGFILCRGDKG